MQHLPRMAVQPAIALACALFVALSGTAGAQPLSRRVIYFTNWAQYRSGSVSGTPCKWLPSDFDPSLATHVMYAFNFIDKDFGVQEVEWNDNDLIMQTQALKKRNRSLKSLISLGGWSFTDPGPTRTRFSDMVAAKANRAAFIRSVLNFTKTHGFDGVDLDWEYPGAPDRGGRPGDKQGLVALVSELRAAANAAGRPSFLMSMAAAADSSGWGGYDLPALAPHLDFISLMTYDYNGAWAGRTGAVAPWTDPLGGPDIASALQHYVQDNGVPPAKLNLGLNLYGRGWFLKSRQPAGFGAPAKALVGPKGVCTREAGYLSWYEVKQMIGRGARVTVDQASRSAYLQQGKVWVSFDLPQTLFQKIQLAQAMGIGGLMAWEASMDDVLNTLMTVMKTQRSPGPYLGYREYSLQVVLTGQGSASQVSEGQKAKLAKWLSPFAGLPAKAIDAKPAGKSLVLSWISSLPSGTMHTRAQKRFSGGRCPTPAIKAQARQVEALLKPLGLRVAGFNFVSSADKAKSTFAVAAAACKPSKKAVALDAAVANALRDAEAALAAPTVTQEEALPGTTAEQWASQLHGAGRSAPRRPQSSSGGLS